MPTKMMMMMMMMRILTTLGGTFSSATRLALVAGALFYGIHVGQAAPNGSLMERGPWVRGAFSLAGQAAGSLDQIGSLARDVAAAGKSS